MNASPYEVLGVPPTATIDEIRAAHSRLQRQYTHDRDKLMEVHRAYVMLLKPSGQLPKGLVKELVARGARIVDESELQAAPPPHRKVSSLIRAAASVGTSLADFTFFATVQVIRIAVLVFWAWLVFGIVPIPEWLAGLLMFPAATVSWVAGGYVAIAVDDALRGWRKKDTPPCL